MHRKHAKWLRVGALLLTAGWASMARAGAVDVPAGALTPGTSFVMWASADGFNEQALRQAVEAVIAVAPAADQERMRGDMDQSLTKMKPVFDAGQQLQADGVLSAVIAMVPQADPGAKAQTQLLLQAAPGSDPKASIAKTMRSVNAWMLETGEGEAMPEEELNAKLDAMKVTKINDTWHSVEVPEADFAPLPSAAEAADPQPFVKAMNGEDGAAVRFAFVMNEANRDAIKQTAADPNNMMMAGIYMPLVSLDTATGGVWLGQAPKLRVSLNFTDEASAGQFKMAVDQMVSFFGPMLAGQAMQDPQTGMADPAQMQAVLGLLNLDQQGLVVSKTIDTTLLTKLTEAGIPWSQQN